MAGLLFVCPRTSDDTHCSTTPNLIQQAAVGGPARRQLTPSSSGYYRILPNLAVVATFMLFTQSLLGRPSAIKRKALQCSLF